MRRFPDIRLQKYRSWSWNLVTQDHWKWYHLADWVWF